jgi:hypothetical protein
LVGSATQKENEKMWDRREDLWASGGKSKLLAEFWCKKPGKKLV